MSLQSDPRRLQTEQPGSYFSSLTEHAAVFFQFPEVVPLNIGGAHFTTRLSTLRRYEDTMLAAMFSGRHFIPTDAEGRYFIDRDGTHFGYVSPSTISFVVLTSEWPELGYGAVVSSIVPGEEITYRPNLINVPVKLDQNV